MKSQLQTSIAAFGILQFALHGLVSAGGSGSVVIAPGAPCTGSVAYCAASNIILRCINGSLQPGNCNDNLNEPPLGALCVDSAPAPGGSAICVAVMSSTSQSASVTPTSSKTSPSASPTIAPGAPCTGSVAYCAASNIILRCSDGYLQPGNCNDNLNEPPLGALCVDPAPPPGGSATCSAIMSSASGSSSTSQTKSQSSSPVSPTGSSSSASSTPTPPPHTTSQNSNGTVATATPVVFPGVAAAVGANRYLEAIAGIGALLAAAV